MYIYIFALFCAGSGDNARKRDHEKGVTWNMQSLFQIIKKQQCPNSMIETEKGISWNMQIPFQLTIEQLKVQML